MFRISNKNKRTIVFITYTKQKEYQNQTKTVARSLPNIGHRTQSDRTPNAIRSGGGRKRWICVDVASGGALVSSAPTKL